MDNKDIAGTFRRETPGATIADENGSTHNWTFTHNDPNRVSPVTGSANVTMDEDTRTVSAAVYNLPTGNYAVVDIGISGLKAGEKVAFYKDVAGTEPVSAETVVPGSGGTSTAELNAEALAADGGTLRTRIAGKKTKAAEITYLPGSSSPCPLTRCCFTAMSTSPRQ